MLRSVHHTASRLVARPIVRDPPICILSSVWRLSHACSPVGLVCADRQIHHAERVADRLRPGQHSGQQPVRQQHALAEAGCLRVFADKLSGRNADLPELASYLDYLRRGDTLMVPSLGRGRRCSPCSLPSSRQGVVGSRAACPGRKASTRTCRLRLDRPPSTC